MTDAEKKPCCCAAEPAEKDTAPSCCRHKDRTPEEYRALANRLSRIEGQVRGIRAMLDKDMEEERRLFYVAMTRAKTRLHVYAVRERYHKKAEVSRFVWEYLGRDGDSR